MNKNVKAIIIILVLLIIAFVIYKLAFKSKFVKGYAKKSGEWVACQVQGYDNNYYQGSNTAGAVIYFKKNEVKLRNAKDSTIGQCADAATNMNVYTLK
jgi:hypothetical protein